MKKTISFYLIVATTFGIGCTTSSTLRLPITRPAEINLSGIDRLAIRDFQGAGAAIDITEELTQALLETGRFEIIDRSVLRQMMEEHNLASTGVISNESATELGKVIGIAALIDGRLAKYDYAEQTSSNNWKDKKGGQHTTFTRIGRGTVDVNFRVVELETGRLLSSKKISKSRVAQTSADDRRPDAIDQEAVLAAARADVVKQFVKTIAPYQDYVKVRLLADKNIPDLAAGISMAKIGSWNDAVELFERASTQFPMSSKAHYNLGVACMHSKQFVRAESALKNAYRLEGKSLYADEIRNLERLRAEDKKLKAQLQ